MSWIFWCRKRGSNPYDTFVSRDFKSRASACSATPANISHAFDVLKYYTPFFALCQVFGRFLILNVFLQKEAFAFCGK